MGCIHKVGAAGTYPCLCTYLVVRTTAFTSPHELKQSNYWHTPRCLQIQYRYVLPLLPLLPLLQRNKPGSNILPEHAYQRPLPSSNCRPRRNAHHLPRRPHNVRLPRPLPHRRHHPHNDPPNKPTPRHEVHHERHAVRLLHGSSLQTVDFSPC
jgi:hypothetical protein